MPGRAPSRRLDQELIQGQSGSDGTYQWVGAQQTAINNQQIAAGAQAAQDSALNANLVSAPTANQAAVASIEQGNSATVRAAATASAALYQGVAQFQDAIGSGVELIDLAQLTDSFQLAMVGAAVSQTRTRNLDVIVVPAGSRATNPTLRQRNDVTASASSESIGNLTSSAFQYQGGAADIELTSGSQQINLIQSATSYAPAAQLDLVNRAGWLGVEPPLPGDDEVSGVGPAGTTSGSSPSPALTRVFSTLRLTSPVIARAPAAPRRKNLVPPRKNLVPSR